METLEYFLPQVWFAILGIFLFLYVVVLKRKGYKRSPLINSRRMPLMIQITPVFAYYQNNNLSLFKFW